jgi:hypothetical protein
MKRLTTQFADLAEGPIDGFFDEVTFVGSGLINGGSKVRKVASGSFLVCTARVVSKARLPDAQIGARGWPDALTRVKV